MPLGETLTKYLKYVLLYILVLIIGLLFSKQAYGEFENVANTLYLVNTQNAVEGYFGAGNGNLDSLDVWIEQLRQYESGGEDDTVIVDSNNELSMGCLQYQLDTFVGYVERYDLLPNAEDEEIQNMIMDCSFQKRLAKLMILEDIKNARHWYTSVYVRGLQEPKI